MYNTGYFESDIGPVYGASEFMGSAPITKLTLPRAEDPAGNNRWKRGNMTVARSRPIRRQLYHFEQFQKYNIVIQELISVLIDILYDLM